MASRRESYWPLLVPAITAVESAQAVYHAGAVPSFAVIDNGVPVVVEDEVTVGDAGLSAAVNNFLKLWCQGDDSCLSSLGDVRGDLNSVPVEILPGQLPDLARSRTYLVGEASDIDEVRRQAPKDQFSFLGTELPLPHTVALVELGYGQSPRQLRRVRASRVPISVR